jgi:hypothetical protein
MNNTFLFQFLVEQNILKTSQTKIIVDAIKKKRKITFDYYGPRKPKKDSVRPGRRIKAEPYAIGLSKKGKLIIRMWVEPPSISKKGFAKTNWRTFMGARMKNIVVTDDTFVGDRPGYKQGNDNSMTVTYISLDKSTQPKPVKQKPPVEKKPEVKKPEKLPTVPKPIEPKPSAVKEPEKLPQPNPEKKPEQIEKEPEVEKPEDLINKEKELPQPKPEEKPSENGDLDKNLKEELKRMKTLMFS